MVFGFDFIRGSGNSITKDFPVQNIRKVKLAGIGSLMVDQSGEERLQVEAEDNIMPVFRIEMRGDELYIGTERNVSLHPTRPIKYMLKVKSVEALSLSGSGDIIASDLQSMRLACEISGSGEIETGDLKVDNEFSMRISGSGNVEIESLQAKGAVLTISGSGKTAVEAITSENLELGISGSGNIRVVELQSRRIDSHISGSGDIHVQGKVDEQTLKISSVGKYKAEKLESKQADIKISGSGSARLSVNERLDVRISGSGSVYYSGRPIVITSISGSGKIKRSSETDEA